MFNNFFFLKSCRLWNVEKYGTAGQATDDNIMRHICALRAGYLRQEYAHARTHAHTHKDFFVFPQQKLLCERASTLQVQGEGITQNVAI